MYNRRALFREIKTMVFENPGTSLSSVARALEVHRHAINQVVYEATRLSFSAWRRQLLLDRALDLLANRAAISVKEISFSLGFSSPRSFARFVRRHLGKSPTEIRSEGLCRDRRAYTNLIIRSTPPAAFSPASALIGRTVHPFALTTLCRLRKAINPVPRRFLRCVVFFSLCGL